jgi:hypothetical protein
MLNLNLNWDNIDWDHFSCVDMTRKIKDEIDAKFAGMTDEEVISCLDEVHSNFDSSRPPRSTLPQL